MDFALWVYPWDLLDEGVHSVAEYCAENGIGELNLATNYHAVQSFLPHNPKRKTFFAQASSYFHPSEEDYGQLSPVPNEQMNGDDWLSQISDEIADTHLTLNSWTIGCHNSRLGMANPDLTLESPFGDSLIFGLCPSQPAVQEYLCSVVSDLSSRSSFKRIELETFDYFYGTGFGWHHDKYHLELGRLGEFLFGLCFCNECCNNAREAGVDVDTARRSARRGVTDIIDGNLPSDIRPASWLRAHSSLATYIKVRRKTLDNLYSDIRSVLDSSVELGRYVDFFKVEETWMQGVDLDMLATHLDYYTVIAYESSRQAAVERVQTTKQLTPDIPLHAGILPGYPAIDGPEEVRDIVDGLESTGVERISFYNYGLLPKQNLNWISTGTERYQ